MFRRLFIACFLVASYFVSMPELQAQWTVSSTIKIARPKNDCDHGFWFCEVEMKVSYEIDATSGRVVNGSMTLEGNNLIVDFQSPLPEGGNEFYAEEGEELTLGEEFTEKFGKTVTLIPGRYAVDRSRNKNGSVSIPVRFE